MAETRSARQPRRVATYIGPTVTYHEWMFVAWVSAVALLATGLPYLLGLWLSDANRVFSGFIYAIEDGNSYLAKMQVGAAGHWLFHLTYTPETHQGGLFFLFYIVLGKLSRLVGLSMAAGLHLSKLFTVPFGLISCYRFIAYWTPNQVIRRLGLILFGSTAGLGWLWIVMGGESAPGAMPVDLWVPDASYSFSALLFPHLTMAQGLLLWFTTDAADYLFTGCGCSAVGAALTGLLVSLIHPYTLPVMSLILGLFICVQVARRRWSIWPAVGKLALVSAPSAPYLVYNVVVFWSNPAFRSWREQSQTVSPSPTHYLLGLGMIVIWAAIGIARGRAWQGRDMGLLVTWVVAVPILLYVPTSIQRRFLDGYQTPLALLGAWGIWTTLVRLRHLQIRVVTVSISIVVMMLSNVLLIVSALVLVWGRTGPVFRPVGEQRAVDWLVHQTSAEVVLSDYVTGNFIPTRGPVRVFLGHGPETMESEEKRELVGLFFDATTDDTWRRRLLKQYGVDTIFWGPAERALGGFDPQAAPYLRQIYDKHEYAIFEFAP